MSKSVAFLLGAGCEGEGQLNLPSGKFFKRDTIVARNVSGLINAINSATNPKIKNGPVITAHGTSILYQTLCENGCDLFSFSDEEKASVRAYLELKSSKLSYTEEEKKTIRDGLFVCAGQSIVFRARTEPRPSDR